MTLTRVRVSSVLDRPRPLGVPLVVTLTILLAPVVLGEIAVRAMIGRPLDPHTPFEVRS